MNQQKSFLSLGGGAMLERFDYELQQAIANIQDPNTPANKPRKVTLTVTLKPDADRKQITHEVVVKSSLQPTNPLMGSTALIPDGGGVSLVEMVPQVPGQIGVGGDVQRDPDVVHFPSRQAAQ